MKFSEKFSENCKTPGVYTWLTPGPAGLLEVEVTVPKDASLASIALLGHPHSLQGGTMHNKVVTTLVRAFAEHGIVSVRFNFRGVGKSEGSYDAGIGESEDLLYLATECLAVLPTAKLCFAGFSFGSYVAYRAAAVCEHQLLLSIAPPMHHYDYMAFNPQPAPWVVIQGDEDEVVPLSVVESALIQFPEIRLEIFAKTGHFFHGKLVELKACVRQILMEHV